MLVNRGREIQKYRTKAINSVTPISVDGIKKRITKARLDINDLYIMQERQCLPSFVSRKKRMSEISDKKADINFTIEEIEKDIHRIGLYEISNVMKKNMIDHFSLELHKIVHKYRSMQQDFLKKISCMEIFDGFEECSELVLVSENAKQMCDIRQSIFSLTTMLIELKMAVGSQTWKLDRIEFFMAQVNENMKNANNELLLIPPKNTIIKNRIIFLLILIISILFFASMIKVSRSRKEP